MATKSFMYVPEHERKNMASGLRRLRFSSYTAYTKSATWRRTRRRLRRDCCEVCATRADLVLHHMTYARLGAERPDDVCTLCSVCHGEAHAAARASGTLYPQPVLDARSGHPPQARDIGALKIGCPTCSARPGKLCRTMGGNPRSIEHKDRRRFADALARRDGLERRRRTAKKAARSVGLDVDRYEAIRRAREAEFPLDDLRRRTRLGR